MGDNYHNWDVVRMFIVLQKVYLKSIEMSKYKIERVTAMEIFFLQNTFNELSVCYNSP